jgi:dihydrolipoamide dehydrogenase
MHATRDLAGAPSLLEPLDVAPVLVNRDRFASDWDDTGQGAWVHGAGSDLIRGHGRLFGSRQVTEATAAGRR